MTEHADVVRAIVEWDWAYSTGGDRLHHIAVFGDVEQFALDHSGEATATCGVWGHFAIPGIFLRMGMQRCRRCCIRLGIHDGVGSPKNDPQLRPWVKNRLRNRESER